MNLESLAKIVIDNMFGNNLVREKSCSVHIKDTEELVSWIHTNNTRFLWKIKGNEEEIRKKLINTNIKLLIEESDWFGEEPININSILSSDRDKDIFFKELNNTSSPGEDLIKAAVEYKNKVNERQDS